MRSEGYPLAVKKEMVKEERGTVNTEKVKDEEHVRIHCMFHSIILLFTYEWFGSPQNQISRRKILILQKTWRKKSEVGNTIL